MKTDKQIKELALREYPPKYTNHIGKLTQLSCRQAFEKGYKLAVEQQSITDQEIEEMAFEMFPTRGGFDIDGEIISYPNNYPLYQASIEAMKALRDKIQKG